MRLFNSCTSSLSLAFICRTFLSPTHLTFLSPSSHLPLTHPSHLPLTFISSSCHLRLTFLSPSSHLPLTFLSLYQVPRLPRNGAARQQRLLRPAAPPSDPRPPRPGSTRRQPRGCRPSAHAWDQGSPARPPGPARAALPAPGRAWGLGIPGPSALPPGNPAADWQLLRADWELLGANSPRGSPAATRHSSASPRATSRPRQAHCCCPLTAHGRGASSRQPTVRPITVPVT